MEKLYGYSLVSRIFAKVCLDRLGTQLSQYKVANKRTGTNETSVNEICAPDPEMSFYKHAHGHHHKHTQRA